MAITILPPVVEDTRPYQVDSDDDISMDSEEDIEMTGVSRPHKRPRLQGNSNIGAGIVTPGEVVTDDPQWMRLVQPWGLRRKEKRGAHIVIFFFFQY